MNATTLTTVAGRLHGAPAFKHDPLVILYYGRRAHLLQSSVRRYFVVRDVVLPPGTIINGTPAPAGAIVTGWPLCKPLFSRLQFRKALKRLKRKHPGAYGIRLDSVPSEHRTPTRVQYPMQANGGAT